MSRLKSILGCDDVLELHEKYDGCVFRTIRAVEQAVLEKLAEQEPLTCDYCRKETNDPWHGSGLLNGVESKHIHACDGCRHLLPHPTSCQPHMGDKSACVSHASDKTVCVSEKVESETQTSGQGFLDSSITPLAQRKIQTLLDKGEYRAIENATVLVNGQGHAAIVNRGGAFYWVDNEALAREFDGVGVGVDSHHIADMRKKVPEGWQLVPVEPIEEMLKKAFPEIFDIDGISKNDLIERYQAMLAEAPKYTGDSNE